MTAQPGAEFDFYDGAPEAVILQDILLAQKAAGLTATRISRSVFKTETTG